MRDIVLRAVHPLPTLPQDIEAELAAFTNLSEAVLWLLVRSTLTEAEQQDATLNSQAEQRALTQEEQTRQHALIDAYDRVMVCRVHGALLLKLRGYDLSDPAVLQAL